MMDFKGRGGGGGGGGGERERLPVLCARVRSEALYHSYGRYEEPLNGSLLFMGSNEVRSILVCGTGLH